MAVVPPEGGSSGVVSGGSDGAGGSGGPGGAGGSGRSGGAGGSGSSGDAGVEDAGKAGLYEVAPERFVAERDDLARRLRRAGDKDGAARVAKLRRPPLTTWALNQVARADPALIDGLLAAGLALRGAMARAVDGDASQLRVAHVADRAANDAVVAAAAARLVDSGYSLTEAMRLKMATTLRAAVVDDSIAPQLRAGTLDRDRDASGFGLPETGLTRGSAVGEPDVGVEPVRAGEEPERAGEEPEPAAASDAVRHRLGEAQRLRDARRSAEEEVLRRTAEAERMEGEGRALDEEADRLATVAEQLEAEAGAARQRATDARHRANVALQAALTARAKAGRAAAAADRAAAVAERAVAAAAEVGRAAADRAEGTHADERAAPPLSE